MSRMSEIALVAATMKPWKKPELFQLVKRLAQGDTLTDYEIAALYAAYLPPTPKKARTPEQWLAQALAPKNECREYLRYIYSDGARLIATNGHRMHITPHNAFPPGFYNRDMTRVELDAKYPDVDRIIPTAGTQTSAYYPAGPVPDRISLKGGEPLFYKLRSGTAVNAAYWDQATKGDPGMGFIAEGAEKPIRLDFENGDLAVVMPVRQ